MKKHRDHNRPLKLDRVEIKLLVVPQLGAVVGGGRTHRCFIESDNEGLVCTARQCRD